MKTTSLIEKVLTGRKTDVVGLVGFRTNGNMSSFSADSQQPTMNLVVRNLIIILWCFYQFNSIILDKVAEYKDTHASNQIYKEALCSA
jgi:hypothetical protein